MKKRFIYILPVLFCISCSKLIEIDNPGNQLTPMAAYKDEVSILAVLGGIYGQLGAESVHENISLRHSLYTDDLITTSSSSTNRQFKNSALQKENNTVRYIWQVLYAIVYKCNEFIDNVSVAGSINASKKEQLIAEAIVIRAFCYFHLVNTYGDVPLLLSSSVEINAHAARTSSGEVYSKIKSDVLNAIAVLPEEQSSGKVRINKYAAMSLLARLCLFTEDWEKAHILSSEIINSGKYSIVPDLQNVFKKNSNEAILQLWTYNGYTGLANLFIPYPGDDPTYPISSSLLGSFETGDKRKEYWIKKAEGTEYYYAYKYMLNANSPGSGDEYAMIFRLAEEYLVRAEARINMNDFEGAISDLNVLRLRAGLGSITGPVSVDSCRQLLITERRRELFTEWGDRFYYLKHSKRIDEIMLVEKPTWKNTASLYPIPLSEILNNSTLTQNPGY